MNRVRFACVSPFVNPHGEDLLVFLHFRKDHATIASVFCARHSALVACVDHDGILVLLIARRMRCLISSLGNTVLW